MKFVNSLSFRFPCFFIFLFLLNITAAFSQTQNLIDANGKKQGYWKKYEGKTLLYEGTFKNDVPIGEFKYYHPNGSLKSVTNFLIGVSKVKTTIYHENGKVASEGVFVDQQKDGLWKYYSDKSQLLKVENYKNGKKNGELLTYSVHGVLLEKENYSDDLLNGTCTYYYAENEKSAVKNYLQGKLNGTYETYYPDNVLLVSGTYHNNLKEAVWSYYDAKGNLRKSESYNHSVLQATYYHFYTNGAMQKMNVNTIAYFKKIDDKVNVILKNGVSIKPSESFQTVMEWVDMLQFVKITPSLFSSIDCIRGYKPIDNQSIIVLLNPKISDEEIRAQDDDATFVKSLFNKELPKDE